MKKYRRSLLSLLLALSLSLSLTAPWALAASAAPEGTEAPEETPAAGPVVEVKEEVESQLLKDMHIEATAAILVDAATGTVLYEQEAHERRYPASITKVMTALLAIEAIDRGELSLDQVITVGSEVTRDVGDGSSTQDIKEGEQLTVQDVLYCALIASANEACNVLAQVVSGSVDSFVELMNQRAQELGMADTHFVNTHGYHDPDHYTTAYDISLMCMEAMKHETFRTIVTSKSYIVPATNLHEERELHETNALVSTWRITGYYYQYATGIKTGSTPEAGYCLAASATKNDRNLISVVMGCERVPGSTGSQGHTYFSETIRLFDWGFDNFSTQTMLDSSKRDIPEVEVSLGKQPSVTLMPEGEISALLPNDVSEENFTYQYTIDSPVVEAPVEAGQELGRITVSFNGQEYGILPLVATSSVERDNFLYYLDRVQKFFDNLLVRILLVVILAVLVILIVRHMLWGGRKGGRRSYAYSGRGRYTGSRRRRR